MSALAYETEDLSNGLFWLVTAHKMRRAVEADGDGAVAHVDGSSR